MTVFEQIDKERAAAAAAERKAKLAQLDKEGAAMVAAAAKAKETEAKQAAQKFEQEQEARLKADIRRDYRTLNDADFEKNYPALRNAELLRRADNARERQRAFTRSNW